MKRILSLRHSFTRHLAILLPLAALLSVGPLFAQSGDDLFRRADSLYAAGIELYNNEDYLAAAELFEECDSLNKAGERKEPYYSSNAKNWEGSSYYKVGDTVRTMRADSLYYMLTPVDQRLTVKSDSLSSIANNYYQAGDIENTIKYLKICAELEMEELGENHYYYGNTLNYIGVCYSNLGEYETALDYFVRSLQVFVSDNNKNIIISSVLGNIAYSYFNNGVYDKAIEYYTRSIEFIRENYSERHEDYVYPLSYLALCYNLIGNYEKSIKFGKLTLKLAEEVYGAGTHNYAWVLDTIANDYSSLGNYEMAVEYRTRIADIRREELGEMDSDYASTLIELADEYANLGNYEKAIEYRRKELDIERKDFGEHSLECANKLDFIGLCYLRQGDYENAIESAFESLKIREDLLGDKHPYYATSLANLANCYYFLRNYEKAIELGTEAMDIRRESFGDMHPDYAQSLNDVAAYYQDRGNYDKSIEIGTKALEIRREILGERHPDCATSLHILAGDYYLLGDYCKAIEFGTEAMEIRREVLGDRHPDYEQSLNNLALYYYALGNYEKAIEFGTEAMEISRKIHGNCHPDYAQSLNNLANYYLVLGNYDKAIKLDTEAMGIYREVLGDRHPDYATSLNTLAVCYSYTGNNEKAIELGTEAMEIQRECLNERNPDFALTLDNLASYYNNLGDYGKAIEIGTEALDIRRESLGDRHPAYATSLNNLATVYFRLDNYAKVIELVKEAVQIRQATLGDRHPDYALTLNNLAVAYFRFGDEEKSLNEKRLSTKIYSENIINNFSFLTVNERRLYWESIEGQIEDGTSYCVVYSSDTSNEFAYDIELLSKGILLSSELEFDKVIKESGDEVLLAKFEQLRQDRLQLEVYYKKQVDERPADEVARLEKEAEQLEKDLIAGSKEYGDFTRSLSIEWADVRDALNDSDLAIEFAKVTNYSEVEQGALSDYYVALMLRKGWEAPKCVNLGTVDDFVPYLAMGSNVLYRSREFSEKVWNGIVETADLKEGERVLFSPDGIFYQMAIEYLPAVGEGEALGESSLGGDAPRTMAEKYQMRRLSSTRELCMEPGSVAEDSAVLYGGLRYERKPKTAETQNESVVAKTEARGSDDAGQNRDLVIGTLLAQRGADGDELDRGTIAYLPGTLAEVDTLATMLEGKSIVHHEFKEYEGKEEEFKAMSGHAPKLIHIATHGFYLSPTEAEELSQQRRRAFLMTGDDSQNKVVDYSMSRTGLLLSESLPAWSGRPVPDGEDDGILTAKEIAGLDLRGVDLAVLSACSTGLGDITGDGVAGLQRGFKKAGVKTLILSLWKVDDDATRQLMTEFYSNYTSGRSKRESFDSAIASLRSTPKYSDPQFWAAFIMLD